MRRRSNPLSERNIKRIDTRPDAAKQTHGFQVCISQNGALHTKHFSDSTYGGMAGSVKAARAYRDEMLGSMSEIEASRIAHTRNAKNKSGHVGISYRKYKNARGKVTRLIAVSVRAERNKTVSRVFRYTKDDHDQVLEQAIAYRTQVLQERLAREGGLAGITRPRKAPKKPAAAPVKKAVSQKTGTVAPKKAPAPQAPIKKTQASKKKKTARR